MRLMVHICSRVHKIMHKRWALGNSDGNESATMQETQAQSLSGKNPLEKEMATHSSILAWKSHGQRSLMGYGPWGHKRGA